MSLNWDRLFKITGTLLIIVPVVLFVGYIAVFFYLMGKFEDVEFARFPNPDRTVEAVIVDRLTNATLPKLVLVYIVPAKTKVVGDPVVNWANAKGLTVTWSDDRTVFIRADSARVYGPKDLSQGDELQVGGNTVRVRYAIKELERR